MGYFLNGFVITNGQNYSKNKKLKLKYDVIMLNYYMHYFNIRPLIIL